MEIVLLPKPAKNQHSFSKYGFESIEDVVAHIAMVYYCYNGSEEDGLQFETMQDSIDGFQAL